MPCGRRGVQPFSPGPDVWLVIANDIPGPLLCKRLAIINLRLSIQPFRSLTPTCVSLPRPFAQNTNTHKCSTVPGLKWQQSDSFPSDLVPLAVNFAFPTPRKHQPLLVRFNDDGVQGERQLQIRAARAQLCPRLHTRQGEPKAPPFRRILYQNRAHFILKRRLKWEIKRFLIARGTMCLTVAKMALV